MENYINLKGYTPTTKCSVEACDNLADYEVALYDFYPSTGDVFYEQDRTCPFICKNHLDFNEANAIGERKPRGMVKYPFTNKLRAQGYSKYNPLIELYPQLFTSNNIENNKFIQIDLNEINTELISYLAKNPEFLRKLHHRKFEELIAEIIRNKGYDVELTPKTRDGGKDIIATYKSPFGRQVFIVECKKYDANNKVGVEVVRALYGVKTADRYNQAVIATTSTFTKDARDFVKPLRFEFALNDFNDITKWCKDYKK